MIDLHTHSLCSDGALSVAELAQRAAATGYRALGVTDHVDPGTLRATFVPMYRTCEVIQPYTSVSLVPGVEITHVPPRLIETTCKRARRLGARLVVVHGESPVEPVPPGTNRAAVEAGVDLLAHPGLIERETVLLAAERGVYLELSARAGHSLGNGRLVGLARDANALDFLVVSSDAHAPGDLLSSSLRRMVCLGAGLSSIEAERVERNAETLWKKVTS